MGKEPDYIDIEFVDILDTGSSIAASAARKYLDEKGGLGLMKKFHAYSSGVLVKLRKGVRFNRLIRQLDDYLDVAIQNKIISRDYAKKLRNEKDIGNIKEFLQDLRRKTLRGIIPMLKENNFERYLTVEDGQQTEAMYAKSKGLVRVDGEEIERKGYVLTMSDLAHNRAIQINSGVSPKKRANIKKLKVYLGLSTYIPDLVFAKPDQHKTIINQIVEAAPLALEKILVENS